MSEHRLRQALGLLGGLQLATGLALAIVPGTFYDAIANFGVRNDHFLQDFATYYLATGVALLMSIERRSWRVPVLFVVTAQYVLHTINHLLDIGDADPGWVGPFDFITLAAAGAVLGYVLHSAARAES